jgi:hypothetical protein
MNIQVFSNKLAKSLIKQGYVVGDIVPNNKYPQRSVFYFKNENGIVKIVEDYILASKDKKLI